MGTNKEPCRKSKGELACVPGPARYNERPLMERIRSGDAGSIARLRPDLDVFNEGRGDVAGWFGFTARLRAARPFSENGAQRGLFERRFKCDAELDTMHGIRTQKMIFAAEENTATGSGDRTASLRRARPAVQLGAGAVILWVVC